MNMSKAVKKLSTVPELVALAVALAVVLAAPAYAQDFGQPNVVLVFMDNFGYGELGVYGGGITRGGPTPRIDHVGRQRAYD